MGGSAFFGSSKKFGVYPKTIGVQIWGLQINSKKSWGLKIASKN